MLRGAQYAPSTAMPMLLYRNYGIQCGLGVFLEGAFSF